MHLQKTFPVENVLLVRSRDWQVRTKPDLVELLGPLGTTEAVNLLYEDCHSLHCALIVGKVLSKTD